MTEPDDTLRRAIDGLVAVERGELPTPEEIDALRRAVWAWMHKDRDKSPEAKALFRQGNKLNKQANQKGKALAAAVNVQRKIDAGSSKTAAVADYAHGDIWRAGHSERSVWRALEEDASYPPEKLRRIDALMKVAKDTLKPKD